MTKEYKITSSQSWVWRKGMEDELGRLVTSVAPNSVMAISGYEGERKERLYLPSSVNAPLGPHHVMAGPNLEHPGTQGAIIFGTFQRLGIYTIHAAGPSNSEYWTSPFLGEPSLGNVRFDTLPELITAVFQALDKAGVE